MYKLNSSKKDHLLKDVAPIIHATTKETSRHNYDILGARMLWKPKEARILTNFIDQPV